LHKIPAVIRLDGSKWYKQGLHIADHYFFWTNY